MCSICNVLIFGTKRECRKRNTQNPNNEKITKQFIVNSANVNANRRKSNNCDWICPKCTDVIFGQKKRM